jgi:hypothetical protein
VGITTQWQTPSPLPLAGVQVENFELEPVPVTSNVHHDATKRPEDDAAQPRLGKWGWPGGLVAPGNFELQVEGGSGYWQARRALARALLPRRAQAGPGAQGAQWEQGPNTSRTEQARRRHPRQHRDAAPAGQPEPEPAGEEALREHWQAPAPPGGGPESEVPDSAAHSP